MSAEATSTAPDRVIVTVVGRNRTGVLAEVTGEIARLNGNILDISQKMMQDYFHLIMQVGIVRRRRANRPGRLQRRAAAARRRQRPSGQRAARARFLFHAPRLRR